MTPCTDDRGHVWLETDGTPYTRHRGRTQATVAVICQYCLTDAELPAFAQHTAPPQQMPARIPIENGDLRATLAARLDASRAVPTDGPVPKHQ